MKLFLIAVKFLTVIPVSKIEIKDKELAKSVAYFPLAGAFIGILLSIIDFVATSLFPSIISSLFLLIALILITGALHLDGFVDFVDGFFSGNNRDKILEIMRDSNIGAFGAIAIVCLILLKLLFLNEINQYIRYSVLISMLAVSRWSVAYNSKFYSYVGKGKGVGSPFGSFVGNKELIISTIITTVIITLLMGIKGLIIWIIAFFVIYFLGKWINRKIGGMTGDIYGAIIEITEVAFLIFTYLIFL